MRLDTQIHGDIEMEVTDGRVVVTGEQVPTVEIVNVGQQRLPFVPVGTRRAAELTVVVDGDVGVLRPGPGKYRRSSYRVLARIGSGPLLLAPSSPTSSRLVRGERARLDQELGQFTRHPDGIVVVDWQQDAPLAVLAGKALRPEPHEVAVGFALAAAFDTGAQFFFGALLTSFDRVLGG